MNRLKHILKFTGLNVLIIFGIFLLIFAVTMRNPDNRAWATVELAYLFGFTFLAFIGSSVVVSVVSFTKAANNKWLLFLPVILMTLLFFISAL